MLLRNSDKIDISFYVISKLFLSLTSVTLVFVSGLRTSVQADVTGRDPKPRDLSKLFYRVVPDYADCPRARPYRVITTS